MVSHSKATSLELLVLSVLVLLSITSGYLFRDIFVGLGTNFFNIESLTSFSYWSTTDLEFLSFDIKVIPLILTFLAFETQHLLFEHKWFFNEIINSYLSVPTLILGRHFYEQYEKTVLEKHGPLFVIKILYQKK